MHNIEIPVVMRQTIKCAKLFFKLVDFNKLKLHSPSLKVGQEVIEESLTKYSKNMFLLQTLKYIGAKLANSFENEVAPSQ